MVSISVYEGLRSIIGPTTFPNPIVNLGLTIDEAEVSNPAVGSAAFFAIEGDLAEGEQTGGPCNAHEYILVDGDDNPGLPGLCLEDDDNPRGNIFNSTINTQARTAELDLCGRPAFLCCNASTGHICGEAGVDIDTFDISAALAPGAKQVDIQIDSGADRIALAVVVLAVNIFEPVLAIDSQIRVPASIKSADRNLIQLGAPFEYAIAVSNTGNAPATEVVVLMEAPPHTTDFEVAAFPKDAGAENLSQPHGGTHSNGFLVVKGFSVAAGTVAETRLRLTSTCAALDKTLTTTAEVRFDEGATFEIDAPALSAVGPGAGDCEGLDPGGEFSSVQYFTRSLRGGGALSCAAATPTGLLPCLWFFWWRHRCRRRGPPVGRVRGV